MSIYYKLSRFEYKKAEKIYYIRVINKNFNIVVVLK